MQVPLSVQGPNGRSVAFGRALVDPGADDTVLPPWSEKPQRSLGDVEKVTRS